MTEELRIVLADIQAQVALIPRIQREADELLALLRELRADIVTAAERYSADE
jgi:hypothetical protein